MNCLSVFDYFVGLTLKGLSLIATEWNSKDRIVPVLGNQFYIIHEIRRS